MYTNMKYDMVRVSRLDDLIASGKIKKFLRSDGWATIGISPLRGMGGNYNGNDRRALLQQDLTGRT
jgi:hypothetical protein